MKVTITSWPMRGTNCMPKPLPLQGSTTRTQQEEVSSFLPSRSQGNWILIRPYWSVQISSPALPTTRAVWVCMRGLGVTRAGR